MLFGFSGVLIGFSGSVLWICVVRNHRLSSLGWSWGCASSISKCMFGKSVRGVVYCSLGLVACNCLLSFSWKDFRGWKAELEFRIFESRDFGRYVRTSGLGRNFPFFALDVLFVGMLHCGGAFAECCCGELVLMAQICIYYICIGANCNCGQSSLVLLPDDLCGLPMDCDIGASWCELGADLWRVRTKK